MFRSSFQATAEKLMRSPGSADDLADALQAAYNEGMRAYRDAGGWNGTGRDLIRLLLQTLGENPKREGLLETPDRMLKMLMDLCNREHFNFTTFDAEGASEMIVQSNIPMHSLCEHHVLPFMGTAAVAYIPNGKIVGLSKLARAVEYCSRGLQNQERITQAIANMLEENLKPKGVGVIIKARHLCMELRGVQMPNVYTTTSCMRGALLEQASSKAEFLELAR